MKWIGGTDGLGRRTLLESAPRTGGQGAKRQMAGMSGNLQNRPPGHAGALWKYAHPKMPTCGQNLLSGSL